MNRARRPDDRGSALVEFTYLAVMLMIPLVYVMLSAFAVQRAAFGVTAAARYAGRAYVTAPDETAARERAAQAIELALTDQRLDPALLAAPEFHGDVGFSASTGGPGQPLQSVTVRLRYTVRLPVLGTLFRAATIPVDVRHTETVDRFRER